MSAVIAPLFTAERDGRHLRAFAAEGSTPELPWFALADFVMALPITREERVELLCGLGAGHGIITLRLRRVVTEGGEVVLVDHPGAFLLLQFIGFLDEDPEGVAAVEALLEDATSGAMVVTLSGVTPTEAAFWNTLAFARGHATVTDDIDRYRRATSHGPA